MNQRIAAIETQLASLPEGKLLCTRNSNRYKWYQSFGHEKTYISKKSRSLAEQLAAKKYLSLLRDELINEKKALELYLHHHCSNTGKSESLLMEDSPFKELLAPYFSPLSLELSNWSLVPFVQNTNHPEHLIHKTMSGHLVRSKSEAMIDLLLYQNKIPFHYEETLWLGDVQLFPDFTIRHPQSGDWFYWEHFGRMEDPLYSKNVYSKLQLYTSYNLIPSVNLITTYETKKHPLTYEMVEKIIEYYFL